MIKKEKQIEEIKKTIEAAIADTAQKEIELKESQEKREEMNRNHRDFADKRENLLKEMSELEKEHMRLSSQEERAKGELDEQNAYMWNEYELTYHNAKNMGVVVEGTPAQIKRDTRQIREEIRALGNVNVNAIEQFRELSERYQFLSGQRDDIRKAEENLVGIIDDLDAGMRRQFTEQFDHIQKEFTKVFKELFGGGAGTLELVDGEDILECGIDIIAQPPGKKLQNMMQLSGGEKSLTAISLLFAIQNLKPSPFCLLDEIEAALDETNVERFAGYLHKLTKHTQFIVITHRRGTMEGADRLYGITMQEKGISAQVSVDLVEAELEKEEKARKGSL